MFRVLGRTNAAALCILLLGILLTTVNIFQLQKLQRDYFGENSKTAADSASMSGPKYVVYGKNIDSGYLKHVYAVLERAGFTRVNYNTSDDWSLMWAHDYPFTKLKPLLKKMNKHQKVNKLPGSGFVTNKVNLATSGISEHIPKAFKVPADVDKFKEYASKNPNKLFVQKNKNHRGIKIEKMDQMNLKDNGSFIQEFVDNPLLIDGYKFDIGVYTYITSIDPLRIYVFEGDALLRFCPEKYHPFDSKNRDKYVVHDDYRPTWKVPTMAKIYSDLGFSFRETLNTYLRSLGKDPEKEVWDKIEEVIKKVYLAKEKEFLSALNYYPHKRSFFEMVRFDFVLDDDLNLYLMEANMSPNLSSKHFAMNRLLYEQVLYALFRLNGVLRGGIASNMLQSSSRDELEMQVANKDLHTFPDECASELCSRADACEDRNCHLCKHCLSSEDIEYLRMAFLEQSNRHQVKRIYPQPHRSRAEAAKWKDFEQDAETPTNFKMKQWYAGKCLSDINWCH